VEVSLKEARDNIRNYNWYSVIFDKVIKYVMGYCTYLNRDSDKTRNRSVILSITTHLSLFQFRFSHMLTQQLEGQLLKRNIQYIYIY